LDSVKAVQQCVHSINFILVEIHKLALKQADLKDRKYQDKAGNLAWSN